MARPSPSTAVWAGSSTATDLRVLGEGSWEHPPQGGKIRGSQSAALSTQPGPWKMLTVHRTPLLVHSFTGTRATQAVRSGPCPGVGQHQPPVFTLCLPHLCMQNHQILLVWVQTFSTKDSGVSWLQREVLGVGSAPRTEGNEAQED